MDIYYYYYYNHLLESFYVLDNEVNVNDVITYLPEIRRRKRKEKNNLYATLGAWDRVCDNQLFH